MFYMSKIVITIMIRYICSQSKKILIDIRNKFYHPYDAQKSKNGGSNG